MNDRTVFFHEDDYGQIELLPAQNWEFCVDQLDEIARCSERNRAPDGIGWTQIHLRREAPASLAVLALDPRTVCARLVAHLPAFDRVQTGYSSYRESCPNVQAFGFDGDCAVYVEAAADRAVEQVWFGLGGPDAVARRQLLAALADLSALGQLLLVDWSWRCLLRLDDAASIEDYLREREAHMQGLRDRPGVATHGQARPDTKRWWQFWR